MTGLTVDALRKRAARGKFEHIPAKRSNDGLFRILLSDAEIATLRPHSPTADVQPSDGRPSGQFQHCPSFRRPD
jgi:hypothetical protein